MCAEMCAEMRSEAEMCARFLPRRLPPSQPRPPQEQQRFTTRAQHLKDAENTSGSEKFDSCRETPDSARHLRTCDSETSWHLDPRFAPNKNIDWPEGLKNKQTNKLTNKQSISWNLANIRNKRIIKSAHFNFNHWGSNPIASFHYDDTLKYKQLRHVGRCSSVQVTTQTLKKSFKKHTWVLVIFKLKDFTRVKLAFFYYLKRDPPQVCVFTEESQVSSPEIKIIKKIKMS